MFSPVDWRGIFVPNTPMLEIFVRGSLTYLGIFLLMRVVLKRQSGSLGMSDLLVVVMLADAAQNGMAGDYKSVPNGLFLVGTILFWSMAVDWLSFRFPAVDRLVNPPPLMLIKDGKMLIRNMRRELITREELMGQLRVQGIDDPARVKTASMEGDGAISIVPFESKGEGQG